VVAVGSTRLPKVNAVREAMDMIAAILGEAARYEIAAVEVPSGVRHTPLTREDMMKGAQHRAEELLRIAQKGNASWTYFVGLEGGFDVVHEGGNRWVFLENWAYVLDKNGRASFGQSGAILVPDALAKTVVDEGVELADAIDAFAGGRGIRDAQGAWGVLTRGLISRQEAFRIAVLNAFSPFFNDAFRASGGAIAEG